MSRENMPSTIHTFSARMLDPLALDPSHVRVIDMAEHLGKQCRFSGATGSGDGWGPVEIEVFPGWVRTIPPGKHYSVAQHTVVGSYQVEDPKDAWDVLHHDDAEYILQDMAKPLKSDERLGQAYRGAEQRIEKIVGPLFDCKFPWNSEVVKEVDLRMLVTEADQLMHGRSEWAYYHDIEPYDIKLAPWSSTKATRKWLYRFFELAPLVGFVPTGEMLYGLEQR